MPHKLRVLLAGRSERALKDLSERFAQAGDVTCSIHLIGDGHSKKLPDLEPLPDVLLLRFDADSLAELAALADSSSGSRPPLIVVGPAGNADAVRLAVRNGARDFLAEPVDRDELVAAVEALRNDAQRTNGSAQRAELVAVVGAAGGVGTSLVACNLALALATETQAPTLLMDLDVNGGPLAGFLDLSPERGLPAALAEVEDVDEQALRGYLSKHHSGLRLMGAQSASLIPARDIDLTRFATLMGVLSANFRYIVADASHSLDDLSVETISMARTVVLVVQQSVTQLKQASRILGTLCNEIGIPSDRVLIVVNRYLKHSTVGLEDIQRALGHHQLTILPSHFKSVLASIDSGMPLLEYDRSSPVSKAIIELQREVVGGPHVERQGLLRRALPIFSGG